MARAAPQRILTGDKELDAALNELAVRTANKIAKAALRGALTVLTNNIKRAAPLGKTGALRASIGKRFETAKRAGTVTAKAGVNVGKRKKTQDKTHAPHSHLVALGTALRKRKRIGGKFGWIKKPNDRQLQTGEMPANEFVRLAVAASQSEMKNTARKAAQRALEREANRLAKRKKT